MSPVGSGKANDGSTDESSGGRLQSYLANVPEDVLAALMSELEKRVRRNSANNDSNNSSRSSGKQNDDSGGKNKHLEMRKKGKKRLKGSAHSSNTSEAETSKQGAKRKSSSSIILDRHVVLSASSSSAEEDESDGEDPYPSHADTEKDNSEIDLSYNVQFRKLSNSEVCFYKGQLLRDEAGREFEQKAADAMKTYCREVDKHFKEIKPHHLQKTLKYIHDQFGDGVAEMDIIRFLKKRWRHWRDNLRRNVRAGNSTRPMHVDDESWKRFVESCNRTYQRQKNAAAARRRTPRTGSGGLMSVRTKFFKHWGSMPTEDMLQEILEKGGYEVFKKKMIAKGFAPKKHKALDRVNGTGQGIIFKAKSRKGKEVETNVCYVDSDDSSENEKENDGGEGSSRDIENGDDPLNKND